MNKFKIFLRKIQERKFVFKTQYLYCRKIKKYSILKSIHMIVKYSLK